MSFPALRSTGQFRVAQAAAEAVPFVSNACDGQHVPPDLVHGVRVAVVANLLVTVLAFVGAAPIGSQCTASAPSIVSSVADTSRSSPDPLIALVPSPFKTVTSSAPARLFQPIDTSVGSLTIQVLPFLPTAHISPSRGLWQPDDTSLGISKPLFGDATVPVKNLQHSAPDRVRPVNDTSQGSATLLGSIPRTPIPSPHIEPIRSLWQPDDTSAGTPKAAYGDSTFPAKTIQHIAPDRVRPVTDTSAGSFRALIQPLVQIPPASPSIVPQRRPGQLDDTSAGTPKTILIDGVVAPSNMSEALPLIRHRGAVVDTSRSSPNALLTVVVAPRIPPAHISPARPLWQPDDASTGIAKALFGDATYPVQDLQHSAPDRIRPVVDTSVGSTTLLASIPRTVIPAPHISPIRALWQPADTSFGTPKVAYGDQIPPVKNLQHTAPDRIRPVTDTSVSTQLSVISFVPSPIVPPPHAAPIRALWQPSDASVGTPKTLYGDSTLALYQHDWPAPINHTRHFEPSYQQSTNPVFIPDYVEPQIVIPPSDDENSGGWPTPRVPKVKRHDRDQRDEYKSTEESIPEKIVERVKEVARRDYAELIALTHSQQRERLKAEMRAELKARDEAYKAVYAEFLILELARLREEEAIFMLLRAVQLLDDE